MPTAQNLTQLMIGRSPMPIAVCTCEEGIGPCGNRSSRQVLHLRTLLPLLARPVAAGGLRYTLDGGAVTASSALYRGPLRLSEFPNTTVVRAVSFEPGLTHSRELTWKVGDCGP